MAEPKNNYKIKPYRSEEENENRQLYRSKDNICRKWLSICSDVNEHGNKVIYEKCLVQAFNLTEFVMDNFIEQIAGINHMGWLLEIEDKDGNDLYPEIRRRAAEKNANDAQKDQHRREKDQNVDDVDFDTHVILFPEYARNVNGKAYAKPRDQR